MTFWFGAVYKSTKLDCSPSNWDNKPVFDLGFRNHIILWGGFNFFLLLAKPLHSYSFKRIVCLCCVLSKIHTKIKRMHLKPVPSYCHVLISVLSTTFCDNLKPSLIFPLWVFTSPDLIFVLPWQFLFFNLTLCWKHHLLPYILSREMDWLKAFTFICPKKWRYAQVQSSGAEIYGH